MRDWWLKFGCFLTGYNYKIVKLSSEASAKQVKKYTSAILLVCMLWAYIGYTFADRYLKLELWGAIAGAIIMVIAIIQIERQIILTTHVKRFSAIVLMRGIIALVMALLGSIIIDQIMFAQDIEKRKIQTVDTEVNEVLPEKTKLIREQLDSLNSQLSRKETERGQIIAEITANPTIILPESEIRRIPKTKTRLVKKGDSIVEEEYDTIYVEKTYTTRSVPNPKLSMVEDIDAQLESIHDNRKLKEEAMLNLRDTVESQLRQNRGFLDELNVMYNMLNTSNVALIVWCLFVAFFLGIELFVLASKIADKRSDYDDTIIHQLDMAQRKLKELGNKSTMSN